MNKDIIEGKWEQLKGDALARWGRLKDNHVQEVEGNRQKLIGMIQENYGIAWDEAERQVDEWEQELKLNEKKEDHHVSVN